MNHFPNIRSLGAVAVALVTTSLVTGCSDDDTLKLDEAAEVDAGAAALFGQADFTFNGVTASVSDVTCTNEGRLVVSPIVRDGLTLNVDGDPVTDDWNVQLIQLGDPEVGWTATERTVEVDDDAIAGSAQMQRADDPTITAPLSVVVDC